MFKGTSCEMVSFLTAVFALAPVIASAVPYKLGEVKMSAGIHMKMIRRLQNVLGAQK